MSRWRSTDDHLPIGLDRLQAAVKADAKGALWLMPPTLGPLPYRCRFCRRAMTTGDESCLTCGAPARLQCGPA
jgi:hypothetical protein